MPLLLTGADLRALLSWPDLIDALERALEAFSAGRVHQPLRTALEIGPERAWLGVMPAYLETPAALGAKLVTVFNSNAQLGLPTHYATVLLLDPETGALAAILEGGTLTALRTAAVSAVSVRHLAQADASVLAILGSGVEARSHLEALAHARRFRQVRSWSPTPSHLARFVDDAASLCETPVQASAGAEEAVRGADVILLATSSNTPVIRNEWVKPGAHVISIGAYKPYQREMDPALVTRARLVVDSRAAALKEAGDIVQGIDEGYFTPAHIVAELGEVTAGVAPGRMAEDDITIFKSLGMAVEDVAAAGLAYHRARESGRGREIDLSGSPTLP
ncbi:MAG: ornithine cyclodeaminase family protein [Acidobacteria bacterium]|nr:ornithine cyclodeaminase family protein [Acidobacteriota bacterium]